MVRLHLLLPALLLTCMLARAQSVIVGDPADPATEMGPLGLRGSAHERLQAADVAEYLQRRWAA